MHYTEEKDVCPHISMWSGRRRITQMRKREKRYGRLYHISAVLGVLVVVSGLIAIILVIWNWQRTQTETIQALNQTIDIMYSEEEMQTMLAGAVEETRTQTETETKEALLSDIREQLSGGKSAVSVLRPLYPDELVVVSNGTYNFVPIRDDLAKHSLTADNLVVSEEGELTYQEDGNIVSHKGIDVSKYQGDIDWKKVSADGVEYAFIRAGVRGYKTGEIAPDETFEKNVKGAYQAGVKVGVYFFSQAISVKEAIEEAEFVLEQIEPYSYMVEYPIVFDVEKVSAESGRMNKLTREERTQVTLAFCERIEEAGFTPVIYGNLEMFGVLMDLEPLEKYEKWYAYYDPSLYYPYDFKVWQYTAEGSVDGIKGNVDLNISFKTWGE